VKVRFTIAHEIAHTFLYDLRTMRSPVSGHHPKELASLERTCNQGAARLLVPESLLSRALMTAPSLDARGLTRIAAGFRVSTQCLVHRLQRSTAWAETGRVALVTIEKAGVQRICASAMDGPARLLFPRIDYDADLSLFARADSLILFGGPENSVEIHVPSRIAAQVASQRCIITCEQLSSEPRTFFVVIARLGGPVIIGNLSNRRDASDRCSRRCSAMAEA
jgi:hypothetical protein